MVPKLNPSAYFHVSGEDLIDLRANDVSKKVKVQKLAGWGGAAQKMSVNPVHD